MARIEQVVELARNNDGWHTQNSRFANLEPHVFEMLRCFGTLTLDVAQREDLDVIWNDRTNDDVAGGKILATHVNQVFEDGECNTLCHVYDRPTGRIPTTTGTSGTFTVQRSMNRPADTKKALHGSGWNVVLDPGECLLH